MNLPVLIVDDDPQMRSLIRTVLSKQGFSTLEARDGASALSIVKYMDGAVSLIVSDFFMPGLDGGALAGLVKAHYPATPFLLMSSEATACDCPAADAFLAKPFPPSALVNTVRRLQKTELHREEKQCH